MGKTVINGIDYSGNGASTASQLLYDTETFKSTKEVIDGKQDAITGAVSTLTSDNLNANIVPISNASGKLVSSNITSTELGYLDGVTSAIQTQLNGKAASSHDHNASTLTGLKWNGDWNQNMDVTPGNYASGAYWVTAVTTDSRYVEGTHAFTGTFYYLFVFPSSTSVQFAVEYSTGRIKSRCYVNNKWQSWTNDTAPIKTANSNSSNVSNYSFHRIAYKGSKASPVTSNYTDNDAIFLIRQTFDGGGYGIIKVSFRTNDSNTVARASATWIVRHGFSEDSLKIGLYNKAMAAYADIYLVAGTYARTTITQLEGVGTWELVNSNEVIDTTTSDKKTSVECYKSIEEAVTILHGGTSYSSIIDASDGGRVKYAIEADSANSATKLTTARNFLVDLSSTSTSSFDGTGSCVPGVYSTLGIENGGTGVTSLLELKRKVLGYGVSHSSPTYVLGMDANAFGNPGATTLAQLKAAMALNNVNNTADSAKNVNYANSTGQLFNSTIDRFISINSTKNLKPYVKSTGNDADNEITVGSSGARFKQFFAGTSTISTSDRNLKDNIATLTDIHKQFFMKLIPVSFTFKDGDSGRTHIGFISQDVEQAMTELGMTSLDFAGFCKDVKVTSKYWEEEIVDEDGIIKEIIPHEEESPVLDEDGNPEYIYSLRYEEFIGIIAYVLQDTVNRLDSIEKRLTKLEG